MITYRSDPQLTARMAEAVKHADAVRDFRSRDDYDEHDRKVALFTQAIPEVLWGLGPLHSVEV